MTEWKKDYKHIEVGSLYLDLKNPRTDSGEGLSEVAVMRELLDENVMELAKDIVQNGYAPVSIFMVVQEVNKDVVVDGNRRLLALKIINNPGLIENIASAKDLAIARELYNSRKEDLSAAAVIIYPDRKEAERDMAKLHLAGIAIQQWRLIRQYRYFQKRVEKDELSIESLSELLALDKATIKKGIKTYQLYEIARNSLPDIVGDIGQDIFTDKKFKTDKFQRAVINSEGERFLGYSFSDTTQKIEIENEAIFLERLRLVLLEIYDSNSSYFSSAQFTTRDRFDFFRYVDPRFVSEKEFKKAEKVHKQAVKSGQTDIFGETEANQSEMAGNVSDIGKSNDSSCKEGKQWQPIKGSAGRSVKDPTGLFWPSKVPYQLDNHNPSLKRVYNELKDIEVDRFPNATHDLLRSFLECSLAEYLTMTGEYAKIQKHKGHIPKLSELLANIINNRLIDDDHVIQNLENIRSNWDKPYSLQRMNAVNHNKNYSSSPREVRATWDMLEGLFKVILAGKNLGR